MKQCGSLIFQAAASSAATVHVIALTAVDSFGRNPAGIEM